VWIACSSVGPGSNTRSEVLQQHEAQVSVCTGVVILKTYPIHAQAQPRSGNTGVTQRPCAWTGHAYTALVKQQAHHMHLNDSRCLDFCKTRQGRHSQTMPSNVLSRFLGFWRKPKKQQQRWAHMLTSRDLHVCRSHIRYRNMSNGWKVHPKKMGVASSGRMLFPARTTLICTTKALLHASPRTGTDHNFCN